MQYIERLSELDRLLREGKRLTPRVIAEHLGVSERQAHNYRRRLLEMGAPIKLDKVQRVWYYTEGTWRFPKVFLTESELLALFLSVEIARSSSNVGLDADLQSAVQKIADSLGEIVSVDLNTLQNSTSYAAAPSARIDSGFYLDLYHAAANRQQVRIYYYSAYRGEWNERVVHPYHLHFGRGDWFLIAYDERHQAPRNFNIARIARLHTLKDHFEREPGFDAAEYIRKMFFAEAGDQVYSIEICFDEYQTRYIRERTWHPDQQLEELPDGSAILRFPASGLNEVARFVLGYGRHACVVGPPELVEIVRSHLQDLKGLYGPGLQLEA